SFGLRYSEETSDPARRPSAGAMPGRCGFCLRGETHRTTFCLQLPCPAFVSLSTKTLAGPNSTARSIRGISLAPKRTGLPAFRNPEFDLKYQCVIRASEGSRNPDFF